LIAPKTVDFIITVKVGHTSNFRAMEFRKLLAIFYEGRTGTGETRAGLLMTA
jgi:hypothetical protein